MIKNLCNNFRERQNDRRKKAKKRMNLPPERNLHDIKPTDFYTIMERQHRKCMRTGVEFDRINPKYVLDHIIPLSKGGLHCLKNICFVTKEANIVKTDKILGVNLMPHEIPSLVEEIIQSGYKVAKKRLDNHKYLSSEKGKEAHIKQQKKYFNSEKGKEAKRRNNTKYLAKQKDSPEWKEKRRIANQKYQEKLRQKRLAIQQ